jgi:hypothetical protein
MQQYCYPGKITNYEPMIYSQGEGMTRVDSLKSNIKNLTHNGFFKKGDTQRFDHEEAGTIEDAAYMMSCPLNQNMQGEMGNNQVKEAKSGYIRTHQRGK